MGEGEAEGADDDEDTDGGERPGGESGPDDADAALGLTGSVEAAARAGGRRAGGRSGPFAGLRNEGATCYLNAVMQMLFHLPAFRRSVFRIPTADPVAAGTPTVATALQRLFWRLQSGGSSQSTRELLGSFGWDRSDAIEQQDISDFCHILLDRLETEMKPMAPEEQLTTLCGVKAQYTDSAPAVGWTATREDTSTVTVLHGVKECADVEACLALLCKPEQIDEYDTGSAGKQTVERRLSFAHLPPILFLNLNRLDFCPLRGIPVKLHNRLAFGTTLDLSPFLAAQPPGALPPAARYTLCSVIVHIGTAQSGHYIAYCRRVRPHASTPAAAPAAALHAEAAGPPAAPGGSAVAEGPAAAAAAEVGGLGGSPLPGDPAGGVTGAAAGPEDGGEWFRFDDDCVVAVPSKEVRRTFASLLRSYVDLCGGYLVIVSGLTKIALSPLQLGRCGLKRRVRLHSTSRWGRHCTAELARMTRARTRTNTHSHTQHVRRTRTTTAWTRTPVPAGPGRPGLHFGGCGLPTCSSMCATMPGRPFSTRQVWTGTCRTMWSAALGTGHSRMLRRRRKMMLSRCLEPSACWCPARARTRPWYRRRRPSSARAQPRSWR